jgi:hypothetical protein
VASESIAVALSNIGISIRGAKNERTQVTPAATAENFDHAFITTSLNHGL